jgi:hypothetical protein
MIEGRLFCGRPYHARHSRSTDFRPEG